MVSAEIWAQQRNLTLPGGRETLIYLLGRALKEALPVELLTFLAENMHHFRRTKVPQQDSMN